MEATGAVRIQIWRWAWKVKRHYNSALRLVKNYYVLLLIPFSVLSVSAIAHISNASSLHQSIIDITNTLEGEGEAVTIPVLDPLPTTEGTTSGSPSLHSQAFLNAAGNSSYILGREDSSLGDVLLSPSSSQNSCMESFETVSPLQLESQELGHDSPESIAALFEDATVREESNDIADDDNLQLLLLATEKVPQENAFMTTAVQCNLSSEEHDPTIAVPENESSPIPLTGSIVKRDMNIQVPEMKSTVRKRRRSVSASGIGAMLLKVVRVSDSAQIVTRRIPKVGSPELILSGADALRARKYVLEKTAQISMGVPAHEESALISSAHSTPAHVCQTESEDAVSAISYITISVTHSINFIRFEMNIKRLPKEYKCNCTELYCCVVHAF